MNSIRRIADVIFVLVALVAWWLTLLADAVGGKLGDVLLLLGVIRTHVGIGISGFCPAFRDIGRYCDYASAL